MTLEEKLHKELDWLTIKHIDADGVIRNILSICKSEIAEAIEEYKEFEDKFKNVLYIFETCDECGGDGMDMEDSYKTCGECHGAGKTKRMNPKLLTWIEQIIAEACKKQRIGIGEKLKGEIDGSLWNSLFNHE